LQNLLLAAGLAGGIAALAGILRLLTFSGALAAFAVGFFIFGLGGLPFAVPLLVFFLSSSVLSMVGRRRKEALGITAKGARRDGIQVLANGVVPAALAIRYATTPDTRATLLLFLASLAAVNADTWATEIGSLFPWRPRLLSTFKQVPHGTSGAVSLFGTLGAAAGAGVIAWAGLLAWPGRTTALLWKPDSAELLTVAWAGFMAAYLDSLLGATLQARYKCEKCGVSTDRSEHCETRAKLTGGFRAVTNDAVNLITSVGGVLFAWILFRYYAYPI
jgi:uncharacterized protein (TIGR00297 family)